MKNWFILVLTAAFVFGAVPVMAADEGLNLVVSPLPINLITEPGATVSAQLKIKNGADHQENLKVGLMKFSAYGDEGKPRLMDREKGDSYFDWVSFSEEEFALQPNEWKTIKVNINVPETAAFGYYYAVTFSRKEDITSGERATKVVGATASLILLEVKVPNALRKIEVAEFSTPKKVYEFLPVQFTVKLKNDGNVHVMPRGNIFIDEGEGEKDVAILDINDQKGNILPDSTRIFESDWNDGFPVYVSKTKGNEVITDRKGREVKELKWDFSQVPKLRIGKYTANMLLVYDDGEKDVPIEGTISFWVVPWRLLGGLTLILGLIAMGLRSIVWIPLRKMFNRNREKTT